MKNELVISKFGPVENAKTSLEVVPRVIKSTRSKNIDAPDDDHVRNALDEENDPSEHFDKSNSNLEESSESGSVNVENSPIRQLGV